MIRRRDVLLASGGLLAAPAVIDRAGAASAFDWKRFKGQKIEVCMTKNPRGDLLQGTRRNSRS